LVVYIYYSLFFVFIIFYLSKPIYFD